MSNTDAYIILLVIGFCRSKQYLFGNATGKYIIEKETPKLFYENHNYNQKKNHAVGVPETQGLSKYSYHP